MSVDVMSFDPLVSQAYSPDVRFDLAPRVTSPTINSARVDKIDEPATNKEIDVKLQPSKDWEIDVRGLVSTKKWLQNYGLKKNRLSMFHILPQIGFKHADNFDNTFKKPIASRYGNGLFQKFFRADGKTFNVACGKEKLRQIEQRLSQALQLYKRRLEWLTSESRRIFGVIEEKSVCLVLDIKNMSPQQYDQYRTAMERVIREQVIHLAKFNMIRATEDMAMYRRECVPVTADSIKGAIDWMWGLDRTAPVSLTATCEALIKAVSDVNNEAVYLFSEGSASDSSRELLREKLTGSRVPVHIVSYNCVKSDSIRFFKDLCKVTGGRFHAYAVVMEMDAYEGAPLDSTTNQANVLLKKRTYGGVPPGAGMREDVILLFEEMEEGRNSLAQIQQLINELPDPKATLERATRGPERSETYMSSREWLNKHGLKTKKLGFFDVLANVAFKHRDGVVDLKHQPTDETFQTDAMNRQKLVNAKYCDRFPCVRWKDGQVVHVQVTPEMHRTYEQKVKLTLEAIQQRIDWLQQGSRELFGTVIEDHIYLLIDTSASMIPHLQFLKDKLFVLMQEQLRHKQRFNLVCFDSKACSWRDRVMEVNEKNLHSAWQWIKGLVCRGSTNTLAALRLALADPHTQAIYLLTDGRPDQPPKSILAQIQLHPLVPIHTISFNCSDREANNFLCELAKESGGRFHYYSENGVDPEGPEPWESEDIRLLRQELEQGMRNLDRICQLRDECTSLAWRKEEFKKNNKDVSTPTLPPRSLYRSDERPRSAPGNRGYSPAPPGGSTHRPLTPTGQRSPRTTVNKARNILRPQSARFNMTRSNNMKNKPCPLTASVDRRMDKNVAGHTKTSLLRALSTNGQYDSPEWLLPETKELFDSQWRRQQKLAQEDDKKTQIKVRRRKKVTNVKNLSSKKWLARHSLSAKKLTILDALAPTFIPHKPKYVPSIDKHVLSKVFDDILPIAHASGENRKKIRIVNPQGVDLKLYIAKVEKAVAKYNKRLDNLVWTALPPSEQQEFPGGVPSFIEERQKLMKALDRVDWPIRERDIVLLENEIRQGESYINQAKDLMEQAKKGKDKDAEDDDDDKASVASSGESTDAEGKKKKGKPAKKTKKKVRVRIPSQLSLKGQRVIARNEIDGYYYPGHVKKCPDRRHVLIQFEEIAEQVVPSRFTIPISGAVAQPKLMIGDYVLARVVNQDTGFECFVPGIIQLTPQKFTSPQRFYTVILYTGQQDHFLRGFLMKVTKMNYTFLVRYIEEVSHKLYQQYEDRESSSPKTDNTLSRSRSESRSSSSSRSRSRSRSRSQSRAKSRSRSRSRSRSSSKSRSRSRSSSKSSSRSGSASGSEGSKNSSSKDKGTEKSDKLKAQKEQLTKWQKQLKKQQGKQEQQQRKLRRQAKKLDQLQRKLAASMGSPSEKDNRKLLEVILNEINTAEGPNDGQRPPSDDNERHLRIKEWVSDQSSRTPSSDRGGGTPRSADGTLHIMELRKSLPVLKVGEEVLARWSDEGWYYRGIVRQNCGDCSYFLEDSVGDLERIWREDIISDQDDAHTQIQAENAVVGLHPSYSFSYAPGVVLEVESEEVVKVRFYDGTEGPIARDEVYPISSDKFEKDVEYILKCEDQWVGQAVVTRNEDTGVFHLGSVKERVGNGRQYVVEMSDGKLSVQNSDCIFGAFTKRHPLGIGDRVLALAQPKYYIYLPGWVHAAKDGKLDVRFCDGTEGCCVDTQQCFWLSQEYYDSSVAFFKQKSSVSDEEEE